jgi:hypothetical protein
MGGVLFYGCDIAGSDLYSSEELSEIDNHVRLLLVRKALSLSSNSADLK